MEYYHSLVTEKSFKELYLLSKISSFVLIGGWAVYFYTKSLKSKDIDIIVEYGELESLGKNYQLYKNNRLAKYEAVKGEVQIDIYLPYYSKLGIPVEKLLTCFASIEGFKVLDINYLFALKLFTLSQRGRSAKGRKDFLDLVSLTNSKKCDLKIICDIVKEYNLGSSLVVLKQFLGESYEILELELNKHKFARLKEHILKNI